MSSWGAFGWFVVWLFGPTLIVVVAAILLSILGALFGFKPPKHKPGQLSWFEDERKWGA